MAHHCAFEGCNRIATRWERPPMVFDFDLSGPAPDMEMVTIRPFCSTHYGEDECPGHVAHPDNHKICNHCGIHIDSLRPD